MDIMQLCDVVRQSGYAAHRYLKNGHVEKVPEAFTNSLDVAICSAPLGATCL